MRANSKTLFYTRVYVMMYSIKRKCNRIRHDAMTPEFKYATWYDV